MSKPCGLQINGIPVEDVIASDEKIRSIITSLKNSGLPFTHGDGVVRGVISNYKQAAQDFEKTGYTDMAKQCRLLAQRMAREIGL